MAESGNESKIIEEVETFIRRLYDAEYVIDSRANDIKYYDKKTGKDIGMSDALALAITNYGLNKDNQKTKLICANTVYILMNSAFAYGFIIHQKSTSELLKTQQEYNQLKQENNLLKEENDKLQKEILRLKQLNEALHQTIEKIGLSRKSGRDNR